MQKRYFASTGDVVKVWHDFRGHDYTILGYLRTSGVADETMILAQKTTTINKDGKLHKLANLGSLLVLPLSQDKGLKVSRVVSMETATSRKGDWVRRPCLWSPKTVELFGVDWMPIDEYDEVYYVGLSNSKAVKLSSSSKVQYKKEQLCL